MFVRWIAVAGVAVALAAMPAVQAQDPLVGECLVEPIVIGGPADDAIVIDGPLLSDTPPSDGVIEVPTLAIEAPTLAGEAAASGHGHGGCHPRRDCGWTSQPREYVVFDVLFLDRDNATNNQTILVDGTAGLNPGGTVMTTRHLTPTTGPGVRLFVGRHSGDTIGWELGYWGVYGWYGDARASTDRALAVPGDIGLAVPGWDAVSDVRATWSSTLNVAELNLLASEFTSGCEPCSPWPQRRCRHDTVVDWIGGLFWAGLDEQAALQVSPFVGRPSTSYRVATSSNLFGGQLGVRGRRTWDRFSLEGSLKAGLGGAWLAQSSPPIMSSLAPIGDYRPGRSVADTGLGFLSTMNLTMAYRFTDVWAFRLGYNLAWLSGVALAPNQWDFTDTKASGTEVRGAGGLFLHGANVGLEARW